MMNDSFEYNKVDMLETYGIKMIASNFFSPDLRERKVTVPTRSGSFDYGAEYHDERTLQLECQTWKELTDQEFDNLKWLLSKKGRIVLWDQPDRFYYGRIYKQDLVKDYFMHRGRGFTFSFTCDPYAYLYDEDTGSQKPTILKTTNGYLDMSAPENLYDGTWRAPTRITIKNTGSTPITGIQVIATEKY